MKNKSTKPTESQTGPVSQATENPKPQEMFDSPESSNIKGAVYSPSSKELIIHFTRSDYKYEDVPADIWKQFKGAESKGSFFNHEMKDKFVGVKL